MGLPTANIGLRKDCNLANGVYFAKVYIDDVDYGALLSSGVRPTVQSGLKPNAECFVLDFDGNVYSKIITVTPITFLRDEMKFSSLEQLKAQLILYVSAARRLEVYS